MTPEEESIDQVMEFLGLRGDAQIEVTLRDTSTLVGVLENPGILFESNGYGGTLAGTPSALRINAGAEGRHLVPWHAITSIKYAD